MSNEDPENKAMGQYWFKLLKEDGTSMSFDKVSLPATHLLWTSESKSRRRIPTELLAMPENSQSTAIRLLIMKRKCSWSFWCPSTGTI